MLTKKSSRGFSPAFQYPTYLYLSKTGRRETANCDGSRMIPTPKGYREVIRYHSEDEAFADYLKWNTEDFKGISDERMRDNPFGIFIGTWRNARWYDEAQRRGLVKEVK